MLVVHLHHQCSFRPECQYCVALFYPCFFHVAKRHSGAQQTALAKSFKDLFRADSRSCDGDATKNVEMAEAQFSQLVGLP